MIKNLIFDLDNTLYPASCGLDKEMEARMNAFIAEYLGLDLNEAAKERRRGYETYGTTFSWLISEKGFTDLESFLHKVHPENVADFMSPSAELTASLQSINLSKVILTNSPLMHAERVLKRLAISHCFERVFDLVYNEYIGKPNKSAYVRVLDAMGWEAEQTLFIDDVPSYLRGFSNLGGHCLLIDESGGYKGEEFDSIPSVLDLPRYVKRSL